MQDIYRFMQTGYRGGHVEGYFTALGVRPSFMEKIATSGIQLPPTMFNPERAYVKRAR
jgi:hypothetical protein